jgi:hypothetical protein
LSLHLPEAITFDPDVQIEKMLACWKDKDEKKTLELVSMDEIAIIIPSKLNYSRYCCLSW